MGVNLVERVFIRLDEGASMWGDRPDVPGPKAQTRGGGDTCVLGVSHELPGGTAGATPSPIVPPVTTDA